VDTNSTYEKNTSNETQKQINRRFDLKFTTIKMCAKLRQANFY